MIYNKRQSNMTVINYFILFLCLFLAEAPTVDTQHELVSAQQETDNPPQPGVLFVSPDGTVLGTGSQSVGTTENGKNIFL